MNNKIKIKNKITYLGVLLENRLLTFPQGIVEIAPLYYFLNQFIELWLTCQSESEVSQSCPSLWESIDCSVPASSLHGIFQARILECVAISFSRGSSWPRDQTQVSLIAGRLFIIWDSREVPKLCLFNVYNQMSLKTTLPWMTFTTIYSRNVNCFSGYLRAAWISFWIAFTTGIPVCLVLLTIHCSFFWNDFWHTECPLKP